MITILETLILFTVTPIGFIMLMSLLLFSEYLILKSVIKDMKVVFNYIKNLKSRITPVASFLPKLPDVIFKRKNILIKDVSTTAGVTINYIKMNNWVS